MQVWILLFVVLFGSMEFLQWAQGLMFPLPVFIAAGVILAIASNNDKKAGLPWRSPHSLIQNTARQPGKANNQIANISSNTTSIASEQPQRTIELPKLNPQAPQKESISFTIHKPN